MGTIKDYIALCRPVTLPAPFVGFVCGSVMAWRTAAPQSPLPHLVWLGAAGGVGLNIFSNALNQVHDLDIDRINRPERPLPAGRLTVGQARSTAAVALLAGLLAGALVNRTLLLIFAAAALCTWLYSAPPARLKLRGLWGNAAIAAARGVLVPVAGWAAVAPLDAPDPWAAGAVLGLFLLGAASTKDFEDVQGDRAHGAATLPVRLGPARAAAVIAPFLVIPFLAAPVFVQLGWLRPAASYVALLCLYGAFTAALMMRHYRVPDPQPSRTRAVWLHMYLLLMLAQLALAAAYWNV